MLGHTPPVSVAETTDVIDKRFETNMCHWGGQEQIELTDMLVPLPARYLIKNRGLTTLG